MDRLSRIGLKRWRCSSKTTGGAFESEGYLRQSIEHRGARCSPPFFAYLKFSPHACDLLKDWFDNLCGSSGVGVVGLSIECIFACSAMLLAENCFGNGIR